MLLEGEVSGNPIAVMVKQLWHLPLQHLPVKWSCQDSEGNNLKPEYHSGSVGRLYGKKEVSEEIVYKTVGQEIKTRFEIVD